MSDKDPYDVAREVTDEALGEGTYAEMNRNHPDPGVQAAIRRAEPMTLRSNISHSEGRIGKPTEPTEIAVIIPIEDATRLMFLHQVVLSVEDDDGKSIASVDGAGGLGSDLITFEYEHSDGEKRRGGFHLAPVLADWIEEVDPKAPAALLRMLRGEK